MQDFNNIKIIGIDHGYGNIKTANTVTPTGVIVSNTEPTFDGNILFYNEKYYRFGEGHKSFISDKTEDEDFYAATLMGIAKELSRANITEANVHIAAGLPLTWVSAQKENFRNYLLRNENVVFVYNKQTYVIHITSCSIHPQGYAGVVDRLREMDGVNMVADIGNGTINILYITDRKSVESKCYTEKMGVNQCMINAQNAVMNSFGAKIDSSIIERFFRYGKTDISERYRNCIVSEIKKYTESVLEILEKYEYNSDLMKLYITGGGANIMRNFADMDKSRVVFVDDICAAAKGYEIIAAQVFRRRAS